MGVAAAAGLDAGVLAPVGVASGLSAGTGVDWRWRSHGHGAVQQFALNLTPADIPARVGDRQEQSYGKERYSEPYGKSCQHVSRLRPKNILRDRAAESRSEPLAPRKLHQDNEDKQQTNDHMKNKQNGQEQPHRAENETCFIASGL